MQLIYSAKAGTNTVQNITIVYISKLRFEVGNMSKISN